MPGSQGRLQISNSQQSTIPDGQSECDSGTTTAHQSPCPLTLTFSQVGPVQLRKILIFVADKVFYFYLFIFFFHFLMQ